ncbi:uncharacterized protein LOC121959229 [Plectropomus leopardus]|uniref:uncharacterized protein LOC121959229 n=1 Tax=Plectropomus leopardus TaxID=160734 RepID=UPI001C4BBA18|nr:uncharacterized protein LOC121959229 [Plectropomus leopardus]
MKETQHLLLLAVFVCLARCQEKPQVHISPKLTHIFSGDLFFLRCDDSTSGSTVKWYVNDTEQTLTDKIWKIGVAAPKHSGSYQCQSNGLKSDSLPISVLDYTPKASLTIRTGQPVVRKGGSVILQLDNEGGLQGWNCWVYRGEEPRKIHLTVKKDSDSVIFQPKRLHIPETIFWCSDNQQIRSNQIIVRTSEKDVSLEMYPLPAVVGEILTLKCLTWGTNRISQAVFYKDDAVIKDSPSPTYEISNVTESVKGKYKCDATFTYMGRTDGPPNRVVSDLQDVFVQIPPHIRAILSVQGGMSCSCPLCPDGSSYHWYHKSAQSWERMDSTQAFMTPEVSGTYACRAVWKTGRSSLSNSYTYQPPIISSLAIVVIVLVILILVAVLILIWYRRRNTTEPVYEDMPLRSQDKGDDQYERLEMGARREGEYDTLHSEAPGRERKRGEYEALKKEEMTGGEYHTVKQKGAVGGEGGYEALKKEGRKEGVYHTLGMEGVAGGEGGYEALKKEGVKEGVYHTLGMEGASGSE